tara:strand:+ start:7956 stop:8489 length:534 start_codon:yes stop_codon:yes gene_type:complete
MNKKKVYNILLALGIVGGIYLLASRVYRRYKSMTKALQDGELYITELLNQLEVVTQDGNVVETYNIPQSNMSFPLSLDTTCYDGIDGGCAKYSNVQKLQVVLLYQISSVPFDLDADGQFGNKTEEAVIQYLNTLSIEVLEANGYSVSLVSIGDDNLNYVTESLYNNIIIPQYDDIIS